MRVRSGEGWGKLPRAIARALAGVNLTRNESKVLWAIIYKTIAFTKEEDKLPGRQLITLTGIEKRHMYRAVNGLLKKGIIFKKGSIFGVQRDFTKWEKVPILAYTNKKVPILDKRVPILGEKVPITEHSRDLSKRAYQEKGLSKKRTREQSEDLVRHVRKLKEDLRKDLSNKKKNPRGN